MNLKQIILIHPIKFVCGAIKEFAKREGVSVYNQDSVNDFAYLVNDLRPEVLAIHLDLVKDDYMPFFEELGRSEIKDTPLVLIGEEGAIEEYGGRDKFEHFIFEPYNPAEFTAMISKNLDSVKSRE